MIRRLSLLLASFALTTLAASPAAAYWEYGHETVARIAMLNVKPATRARVRALLAHATDLDRSEERRVGKSVSVRVDIGGRRRIKKKKKTNNTTNNSILIK